LDFLGFSRPNLDLSMGYADFCGRNFLRPVSPCFRGDGARVCGRGYRKGGLLHEASLIWLLFFCKKVLALIAITVEGPASAVMAGLVPAIHVVRLRHRFAGQDNFLSSIA
jgi:hypothetical protein